MSGLWCSIARLEPRRESSLGTKTVLLPSIRLAVSAVVAAARRQRVRACMRRDYVIGLEMVSGDALSVVFVGSSCARVEEIVHALKGSTALAT